MSKMKEYAQEIYGDSIDFGYSLPFGHTESIRILSENRELKSALENIIKECVPGVAGYHVIKKIAEGALETCSSN